MRAAVLVPVKDFRRAKRRLSDVLTPTQRQRLAREMASLVVCSSDLPTFVVCDDADVATWARGLGVDVLWRPETGLNGAVLSATAALATLGYGRVLVAHSDLPLATGFTELCELPHAVTLVPDRHGDGTNVCVVPTACGFRFSYGRASFRKHQAEANRLGLGVVTLPHVELGWDIDRPDDLIHPAIEELFPWLPTNPANQHSTRSEPVRSTEVHQR